VRLLARKRASPWGAGRSLRGSGRALGLQALRWKSEGRLKGLAGLGAGATSAHLSSSSCPLSTSLNLGRPSQGTAMPKAW
jgi:hypothetical protein